MTLSKTLTILTNMDNRTDFGNSTPANKTTPVFPEYIQIYSTIFYVLIFIFGVLGNVLVIVVVCLNRNMKTSVNIYLINLCVADLLVLTVCMPTALVDVYARDVWYFGEFMCLLVPFLENTVAHASVLTLVAIGIERYRVICRPLRGIRDDILKSMRVVPCLWVLCAAVNIPWFYAAVFKDSRHLDGTPIKVCRIPMVDHWPRLFTTLQFVVLFVCPFLILLILYSIICHILYFTQNDTDTNLNTSRQSTRNRKRLRLQVINIIICLVILFFIFHLPYRIVSMWFTLAPKHDIRGLGIEKYYNILYSVRILFYLNHAMNPIIYNFVSTKFRSGLRLILTKREHRGSLISSNNKRANFNAPFTKPKHMLLAERDNGDYNLRTSSSSSTREKMNEFYPMYSNIIDKQDSIKM